MPNILKYRDEYTERKAKKSGQNREKVRPSRAFLTETDTETEKETLPLPSLAREGGGAGENADSLPDGQTPREAGTNPRALGTNPRALGPTPRARGANRRARDAPPSPASSAAADASGEAEAGTVRLPDEMGLDFQQFLDAYPPEHREPAGEAVRAWCRLAKARKLPGLPRLLDGIAEWQNSEQWRKDNGRFIPKAANFLKNTMWLSAPPAAVSAVPTREQLDAEAARLIDFTAVEKRPLWRLNQ